MRSSYIAIIMVTSLASSSFTAAFFIYNSTVTKKSVHIKEISTHKDSMEIDLLKMELAKFRTRQESLEKSISSLNEDIEFIQQELTLRVMKSTEEDLAAENTAIGKSTDINTGVGPRPEANKSSAEKTAAQNDSLVGKNINVGKTKKHTEASLKPQVEPVAKVNPKPKSKRKPAKKINRRHDYLVRQFKKEKRDPEWSGNATIQIMDSITGRVTGSSEFLSMDCRSTFCRLRINHRNKALANQFLHRLGEALKWSNSTLEVFFVNETKLITDIFIFRNGEF